MTESWGKGDVSLIRHKPCNHENLMSRSHKKAAHRQQCEPVIPALNCRDSMILQLTAVSQD